MLILSIAVFQGKAVAQGTNGKIVFHSNRSGNYEIYTMNADGSDVQQVTHNPAPDAKPHFSPDGSKIVFSSFRNNNYDIYMIDVDGLNETRLTTGPDADIEPAFSSDGHHVAFSSWINEEGGFRIALMNLTDKSVQILTSKLDHATLTTDYSPCYSPDGNQILFYREQHDTLTNRGYGNLMLISSTGGEPTLVTDNSTSLRHDQRPRFHPNGHTIVFQSAASGVEGGTLEQHDLYTMNLDGTERRQITDTPVNEYAPVFNLDGTQIAYEANPDDNPTLNSEIFLIDFNAPVASPDTATGKSVTGRTITGSIASNRSTASGTTATPTRLTNNSAADQHPGWGPHFVRPPSRVSINDLSITEGNPAQGAPGTTNAVFTVTLSTPNSLAVTVTASTAVGTASEPGDFTMTSQTLTIPAGQTSATFSVPIVGDTLYEADETFTANLSNPVNAVIADGQGRGTITNDDNDVTAPTVRFTTSGTTPAGTTPVSGSTIYNVMPTITGVAADSGSGVAKVELRLHRVANSVTEFWSGTTWGTTQVKLTATLNPAIGGANVSWSKGAGWPTGGNLSEGTYYLTAYATDRASKVASASSNFKFFNDTTAPTVSFTTASTTPVGTTPVSGSTIYNAMPTITGVAADSGSGIAKAELRLHRVVNSVVEFWNGTAWTTTNSVRVAGVLNPTTGGANVSWSKSDSWPTGANFSDNTYYLTAYAYDKVGKVASASSSFKKLIDNELPTVRFTTSATTPAGTTPVSGSTITGAIPTITGEAADTGSGVAKVELRLHRVVNSIVEFWNGTAWGTTQVKLAATLNPASGGANVSWSKGAGWPTGGNLTDGTYYLTAYATDKANKIASASSSFKKATVAGLSPGAIGSASSAVTLSTSQALADSQSIKLSFTGALSSTSASQTTNYSVSVNGTPVEVQKATYEGASSAVTLQLAVGTLEAGDTVTVSWNLRDSSGQTVRGQTELTVE
jgi:Tol biopolymer transport system component